MRILVLSLSLLALCAAPASADERTDKARTMYESGMAHFNLDEYDAAIADFQEAYRNKPDPTLLYNIAQAARLGKRTDMAIDYYEKYVRLSPAKTANLANVREQIETLKKLRRAQDAALGAKPRTTIGPEGEPNRAHSVTPQESPPKGRATPAPDEPRPGKAEPAPSVEPSGEPEPLRTGVAPSEHDESTPIVKRWYFWAAAVAVVAVIAGGIALGITMGSGGTTIPMTTWGPVNLER